MLPLFLLSVLASTSAWAVPAPFTTQGRMVDSDGAPVDEDLKVTFRLVDDETGGSTLWSETQTVTFRAGYYSVVLGADETTNPLTDAILEQSPLYLEVQVEGQAPMFPRSAVGSVPYARVAGRAEEVAGGPVDASSLKVDGVEVVDENGAWVGPPIAVGWSDLDDVPPGFADGEDADTLASLGCAEGQQPVYAAAGWVCADTALLVGALESDLAALSLTCDALTGEIDTLGGAVAVLESGALVSAAALAALDARVAALEGMTDADTLADLACEDGQEAQWDADLSVWVCGDDDIRSAAAVDAAVSDNGYASDSDLLALQADLAAADAGINDLDGRVSVVEASITTLDGWLTALTTRMAALEATVASLTSSAFSGSFLDLTDVPAGIADGDADTLAGLSCSNGQVATWQSASGWTCQSPSGGISAASVYQVSNSASGAAATSGVRASCLGSDVLLGGGCSFSTPGLNPQLSSTPSGNSYFCGNYGYNTVTITAVAICAPL